MHPIYRRSIGDFLSWASVALENALNSPDVQAAMSAFGYDEARLLEGVALLETALSHRAGQKEDYGKQYAATLAMRQAWHAADRQYYALHRRLVRLILRYDADLQRRNALGLNVPKSQRFNLWLDEAVSFYNNVLQDPQIQTALASYNVTLEDLEQGQAAIQEVKALKGVQDREKTQAQQATKDRDAVFKALNEWLAKFREVARIALADSPQHRESLQLGHIP